MLTTNIMLRVIRYPKQLYNRYQKRKLRKKKAKAFAKYVKVMKE